MQTVTGVIIRERQTGESDKQLSVLTRERGIIEVTAKGAMKLTSKNGPATALFSYSRLCFNESKGRNYLNSSEPVELFYNIRLDVRKYALACYFADIALYTILPEQPCEPVVRLFLNTLYFLDNGRVDYRLLKPVFEFRFVCEIGMMPQLLCCRRCYRYSSDIGLDVYFDMRDGMLECEQCHADTGDNGSEYIIRLSPETTENLRYIALTEFKTLFKLKPSEKGLCELTEAAERYIKAKLGRSFASLQFYRNI